MQWIVLADMHGSVGYLPFIVPEMSHAEGVFIAGDITNFGGRNEAQGMIDSIAAVNENILAVAGNCDLPSVGQFLNERGMNVHGQAVVKEPLCCVGVSGSLPCPGATPQEKGENEFSSILEQAIGGACRTKCLSANDTVKVRCRFGRIINPDNFKCISA